MVMASIAGVRLFIEAAGIDGCLGANNLETMAVYVSFGCPFADRRHMAARRGSGILAGLTIVSVLSSGSALT